MFRTSFAALLLLLSACFSASADPANDPITESGDAYAAIVIADQWSGAVSMTQLWNPPGSGRLLYVDSVRIARTGAGWLGCDIRHFDAQFGTKRANGLNKFLGGAASVAETRWGNVPGSYLNDTNDSIIEECWIGASYDDRVYEFDPAIVIPPGHGLNVATANETVTLVTSFQYREKPTP